MHETKYKTDLFISTMVLTKDLFISTMAMVVTKDSPISVLEYPRKENTWLDPSSSGTPFNRRPFWNFHARRNLSS